jgi:hypothetical protein
MCPIDVTDGLTYDSVIDDKGYEMRFVEVISVFGVDSVLALSACGHGDGFTTGGVHDRRP